MKSQCDRILDVLSDGQEHSHHEFYGWCVLHSRVAELRKRGYRIEQRREGDLYLYRLQGSTPEVEAAAVGDLADRALPEPDEASHEQGELERPPYVLLDGQLQLIPV